MEKDCEGGAAKLAFHSTRTFNSDIQDCNVPAITTESLSSQHSHPDLSKAGPLREAHDYCKLSKGGQTTHFCSLSIKLKEKVCR